MRSLTWALLVLGLFLSPARAAGLDINLSDRALRGEFTGDLSSVFPRVNGRYELGGLAVEKEVFTLNQGHLGVQVTGDAGAREANVNAGLGGRLVVADANDDRAGGPDLTGGALALGGMLEVRLPAFNRIGMFLYAYGAPRAASFGDYDGYLEYAVSVDYQVLRNASLYAGFRQVKLNPEKGGVGEFSADTGWHLGLRLNF